MIHSACHVPASPAVEAYKCWEMAVVCTEYSTMQLLPLPAAKGPCPHPKSSYVHLQIINNHSTHSPRTSAEMFSKEVSHLTSAAALQS
jgi:hypothetical protein